MKVVYERLDVRLIKKGLTHSDACVVLRTELESEGNMRNFNSRDEALELVENGIVSAEAMLTMALKYMSTDDVADMLDCNELSSRFMDEDLEEEDDGQPDWAQEWEDFGECYE